jgi:hypothetical protein
MLHDIAVTVTTFITIMGSVLAHDVQQLSTTVANLFHPATATSITYAPSQPASASTPLSAGNDPFHTPATSSAAVTPSAIALAPPVPKNIPAIIATPKSSAQPAPVPQGKVLGASTVSPIALPQLTAITTVFARALNELEARVDGKIASSSLAATVFTPPQVAAGGTTVIYQTFPPASQRIDNLANTTITSPTISGGTIRPRGGRRLGRQRWSIVSGTMRLLSESLS